MYTKKRLAAGVLGILAATALILPASAHGHGHHGGGHHGGTQIVVQSTAVAVCPVEGCDILDLHCHDGTTYCGYDHTSGSCDGSTHQLCDVEGCITVGHHTHGGEKCRNSHVGAGCHGKIAC